MLGVSFTPGQGFMLRKSWATQKRFQGSFVEGGAFFVWGFSFCFCFKKERENEVEPIRKGESGKS